MEDILDDYDVQMQQVIESSRKRRQQMDEHWINRCDSLASESNILNQDSPGIGGGGTDLK